MLDCCVWSWPLVVTVLSFDATSMEPISATLVDGRRVTGLYDARTDRDYLRLIHSAAEFQVISGFGWDQVAEIYLGQQLVAPDDLRRRMVNDHQPNRRFLQLAVKDLANEPKEERRSTSATVKSLVVHAELAQWDSDTAWDGFIVDVVPLDQLGRPTPVQGHVEMTLVAGLQNSHGGMTNAEGPIFREQERISYQVRRSHFGDGVASYRLPFRNSHPDFQFQLSPDALIHVRLSVPSVGVFEASDACAELREVSRFRDDLQQHLRQRYLPLENANP